MLILLVEDEDPKREHIVSFLKRKLPAAEVITARSVRAAISRLRTTSLSLVLIDMSLPTFDVASEESGGRPQGFGGMEILRYMDRFKIFVPTIVITAYEAFVSEEKMGIDLISLSDELKTKHPKTYRGLIYYNSIFGGWEEKLSAMLDECFDAGALE